ncbi:MAG: carbohydrate porin [Cyanobacteria bacterium K_DeepCast_35m_m2_023]|nr:carbohydrate porin [Cyanobacteria bacterium K_DeepCast_35m_m2_023]
MSTWSMSTAMPRSPNRRPARPSSRTSWPQTVAYQALSNLIGRYGCVAGEPGSRFRGNGSLTRFEAAALLNACLDRVTVVSDELRRLIHELAQERVILNGRIDGLGSRIGLLEAQSFSTTTRLGIDTTMVLGGNGFLGSASNTITQASSLYGAVTFNYDTRLSLNTSFNGRDLLHARLRAGNFNRASNTFFGAGPTRLSQLEAAFEETNGSDIVALNRLYYQFPVSDFTVTFGGLVEQDDMLAMFPSVYPDSTILDLFTMAGSPVGYDFNLGPGAGIWWTRNAWSVSLNYIAQSADIGDPAVGGIGTQASVASTTLQLGYRQEQWAMALVYSAIQGDVGLYSTKFLQPSFFQPGMVQTLGLSGYWQPRQNGWIPSISAGAEITQFDYSPQASNPTGTNAANAVAWSVGLQWLDVLAAGNSAGMAFGQAPHATSLVSGGSVNDDNWMWEWWTKFQLRDSISVTPGLFYLSRPMGQDTPAGQSFNQLGALIKTRFKF